MDRVLCTSSSPATDVVTLSHVNGREETTKLCGYNTGHHGTMVRGYNVMVIT